MNTEILGVALQVILMVVLAYPLGKYIAKVYKGQKTWSDFMKPVERLIFKVSGINPQEEMNWKQFLKALLILNAFWFVWGMVLLVTQHWLPLNPDGNGPQSPDQAFNTCISFMVNCNLQHYSGESGLTYFTQLFVIMLFQFITAATGMAAMAGIMKSIGCQRQRRQSVTSGTILVIELYTYPVAAFFDCGLYPDSCRALRWASTAR
ncbi:MAG: potassium-transporting ATPase subunit KdpA [Bacteroides cellulosilyticus]